MNGWNEFDKFQTACGCLQRPWHKTARLRSRLHPLVQSILEDDIAPIRWQELLLQWPHVSSNGEGLAYFQTEARGVMGQVTVTTPGRYVKRHWPDMPDHEVRDRVALLGVSGCEILVDMDEIVQAVIDGPQSCMKKHGGTTHKAEDHPYRCYHPKYGWGLAVQRVFGEVKARALVNCDSDGNPYFVRTFEANGKDSIQASTLLNAWLKSQGYEHRHEWEEGTKLEIVESTYSGQRRAPYLDGCNQQVNDHGSYLSICYSGDYNTTGNPGWLEDAEHDWTCYDCGSGMSEDDDRYEVGYHSDNYVCSHCHDSRYTEVYGRRRQRYSIRDRDSVRGTDGEYYDPEYLDDNDMVYVAGESDDVAPADECVYIESEEAYYLLDNPDIVCCEDDEYRMKNDCEEVDGKWYQEDDVVQDGNGDNILEDEAVKDFEGVWWKEEDTWECEESGEVYHESVEAVVIDGDMYHPSSEAARLHLAGKSIPEQTELELA